MESAVPLWCFHPRNIFQHHHAFSVLPTLNANTRFDSNCMAVETSAAGLLNVMISSVAALHVMMSSAAALYVMMSSVAALHVMMSSVAALHVMMSSVAALRVIMSSVAALHVMMSSVAALHVMMSSATSAAAGVDKWPEKLFCQEMVGHMEWKERVNLMIL